MLILVGFVIFAIDNVLSSIVWPIELVLNVFIFYELEERCCFVALGGDDDLAVFSVCRLV